MTIRELKKSSRRTKLMFYMADRGLDTSDIARLLGISRQSFSYLLNGRVDIKLSRLIRIAEILKVNVKTII